MSYLTDILKALNAKQRRRVLFLTPLVITLLVFLFFPKHPCKKVVENFSEVREVLESTSVLQTIDTFALSWHCDTFSLINDKSFWVIPKCGKAGQFFRDSIQVSGRELDLMHKMRLAKVGAIHYHYPSMSFEFYNKFRGGYDFRLVYNRNRLKEGDSFWSTCDQLQESQPDRYYVYLSPHWYIAARKL